MRGAEAASDDMKEPMRCTLTWMLALTCAPLAGCAELNAFLSSGGGAAVDPKMLPAVQTSEPALRRSPAMQQLAAYYCPRVIGNPIAALGCSALGGPPSPRQLEFEFGMTVTVKNPNNVPIPMLDVLLALKLFSGQDAESLGAICVSLCGAADASCTGAPKPDACTATNRDVPLLESFAARVPGLIAGLASGQLIDELRKSSIVAGGDVHVDLAFTMGVDQALRVIEKVARRFVDDAMSGRLGDLAIPVSATGTVFVQLPAVGRVGVGFGPVASTWRVPTNL
jgi:hypothetical protein